MRLAWALVFVLAALSQAAVPRTKPPELDQLVQASITASLDQLEEDGDFVKASADLSSLFDQVIVFAPKKKLDVFRDAAFALRLVKQLQAVPTSKRIELLKYMRANRALAGSLVFLMRDCNSPEDVYALLARLREKHAKDLEAYAALTAAICVVHDRPLSRHLNENETRSPDAIAIFDYYKTNEARMALGVRTVPAELLIHVIDTTASIDEMSWALARYAGMRPIGQLYSAVRYDDAHVRTGRPKRVSVEGYNLPNLLAYGGVCIDQAYFASAVGKAIGIPTAIDSGIDAKAGHAWLGFFQLAGRVGQWNFDVGRFESYRGVQGRVSDPQTREKVPDTHIALMAELAGTTPQSRQTARALVDAAHRLMALEKTGTELKPDPPAGWSGLVEPKPRKADIASALELVELAVRQSPGDRFCWEPLRELATGGKLTLDQKKYWTNVLQYVCGAKYPDFLLSMLVPMVGTVADVKDQDRLWNWLFDAIRGRPDLAAQIRMEQAAMWEKAGSVDRAGACYMDVIERYANAGPFVIDALSKAEGALKREGQFDRVPMLYEATWSRLQPPKQASAAQFASQSNWYRVGTLLASKLDESGMRQQAQMVRMRLSAVVGTPSAEGMAIPR